jgi:signal peptidase I
MVPTLLVKDHIFVNKLVYGLRLPFTSRWIIQWRDVQRGEVVVFRSPQEEGIYLIKRVVAIEGDHVSVDHTGRISINGKQVEWISPSTLESVSALWPEEARVDFEDGQLFDEVLPGRENSVRRHSVLSMQLNSTGEASEPAEQEAPEKILETVIPPGHFLAMGDNRDRSSDGRVYGPTASSQILGRASWIWLSCREFHDDQDSPLCGLNLIDGVRWWRFGKLVE